MPAHQSEISRHCSQVDMSMDFTIAGVAPTEAIADPVVETLRDRTSVEPMSGALALMAVRIAEREDSIGTVAGLTDRHRQITDLLIRRSNVIFIS